MTIQVSAYICTSLRSPMLLESISSVLNGDRGPQVQLSRVVLVVNDKNSPDIEARITELRMQLGVKTPPLETIFEARRGIPFARNRALDHAIEVKADWLAFIDDDCVADRGWLNNLADCAANHGYDAVAGAWSFRPHQGPPSRLLPESVLSPVMYYSNGKEADDGETLPYAYTRSVLMNTTLIRRHKDLRFDTSRNLQGGSDVAFFVSFRALGGTIGFSRSSEVVEFYSGKRLRISWHASRRMRNIQFIMERALEWKEPVFLEKTFSSLILGAILTTLGGVVKFVPRSSNRTLRGTPPLVWVGKTIFAVSRLVGLIMYILGIRHNHYDTRS